MVRVKVCGITTVEQAIACVELGVDAIGVNLIPWSPRHVDEATARAIARAVGDRTLVVAVVADLDVNTMRALVERTGAGCLQLHGDEPSEDVAAVLPHAYKAVRIAGLEDVASAAAMPGDYVMVDARVPGALGGTGHAFDWGLVAGLARTRRLVLAGGLRPENVATAVAVVRPWCVDVATGVESSPGVKDMSKVEAFLREARGVVTPT
jgi:phosphoribosylanthranilate isomerase